MNQMGGNYGYSNPQQQGYNTQAPQTQQAYYQQFVPKEMQQPAPGAQAYQGGPLEASGGPLIPVTPGTAQAPPSIGMLPLEQSYIENILRLNRGKLVTVHTTFGRGQESSPNAFTGIVRGAGRDHVLLKDPQTGTNYLLLMVYVDYVSSEEDLEYDLHPYSPLSSYSSR